MKLDAMRKAWVSLFTECPKLARTSGAVEIEHNAMAHCVSYDSGLISKSEVADLWEMSNRKRLGQHHNDRAQAEVRFERLLRHRERVASHESWPNHVSTTLRSADIGRDEGAHLDLLEKGGDEFKRALAAFRRRPCFRCSKWEKNERPKKKRVRNRATKAIRERRKVDDLRCKQKRWADSPLGRAYADAGEGMFRKKVKLAKGGWCATLDTPEVFVGKKWARQWALHLESAIIAGATPSQQTLAELKEMDAC